MKAVVAGCEADSPERLEAGRAVITTRIVEMPSVAKLSNEGDDAPFAVEIPRLAQVEDHAVTRELGGTIDARCCQADPLMAVVVPTRIVEAELVTYADRPGIHTAGRVVTAGRNGREDGV